MFQTTSSQTEVVPFGVALDRVFKTGFVNRVPFALESTLWRHLEVKPFMTGAVQVEVLV